MLMMHTARRQNRNSIDIIPCQKIIDIATGWNTELRCDRIGPLAVRIADGDESGTVYMISAQQLGMTLGNTPAAAQAKSNHRAIPFERNKISGVLAKSSILTHSG
jgi:hypothetical protein